MNDLHSAIEKWVRANIPYVLENKSISIHIDKLLQRAINPNETLDVAISSFKFLWSELDKVGMPVQPSVIIPLQLGKKKLKANCPKSIEKLEQRISKYEPPGLYMEDWSVFGQEMVCEEYKTVLPFKLFEEIPKNVYIYYREWRNAQGIIDQEEFSRDIYIKGCVRDVITNEELD